MKLNAQRQHSVNTNVPGKSNFKIEASHKAFEILSSGIYSDTISAIMRELACNAYDAQVVAGKKDVPIKVHLPTKLEPWFSVTDVGCGMSEQDIYDIYTSYFTSTKTDSNDVIGALGLGSKSPFSYTESFTVESSKDGLRNSFVCFIDETGMPSLTKVNAVESVGTGTTVKVPIKEEDFRTFINKAREVFVPFYPQPEINLQEDGNDEFAKILYRGKHCMIIDRAIDYGHRVVQGNVAYKVNYRYTWGDNNVLPIYNIGELSFTASREELHYDDMTAKNLDDKEKQKAIRAEVKEYVDGEILKQPDLISAIKKFRYLRGIFSSTYSDKQSDPLVYEGFELTNNNIILRCPKRFAGKQNKLKARKYSPSRVSRIQYLDHNTSVYMDEVEVFYMDVRAYTKRVNQYVSSGKTTKHVVVLPTDDPKPFERLAKGVIEIKPVSSLPEPPKAPRNVPSQSAPAGTYDYSFSNAKLVPSFGHRSGYREDVVERGEIASNAKKGKTQYYFVFSDDVFIARDDYPYLSYMARVMFNCLPWDIMMVPSRSRNIKVFERWNERENKELFVNVTDILLEARTREWDSFYYLSPMYANIIHARTDQEDLFWASKCLDEFGSSASTLGSIDQKVGLGDGYQLRRYQQDVYQKTLEQYPLLEVTRFGLLFDNDDEEKQRKLLRMIMNSTKEE